MTRKTATVGLLTALVGGLVLVSLGALGLRTLDNVVPEPPTPLPPVVSPGSSPSDIPVESGVRLTDPMGIRALSYPRVTARPSAVPETWPNDDAVAPPVLGPVDSPPPWMQPIELPLNEDAEFASEADFLDGWGADDPDFPPVVGPVANPPDWVPVQNHPLVP